MKILYVVPDFKVGGVTTVVQSLDAEMKSRGCDSKIICLKQSENQLDSLNINSKLDLILALLRLKKIVSEYKPDIIHSHTIFPHLIVLLYKFLFNRKIIIINTEHGSLVDDQKDKLIFKLYKILSGSANKITFVSKFSAQTYLDSNIISKEKIKVVYNGIGLSQNLTSKINDVDLDDSFKFCYIGRFSPEKNVILLIQAFQRIQAEQRGQKISLYLVGNGEQESFLKSYCSQNDIKNIYFLGFRQDITEILNSIDCLVLSSLTEGLPMVILEAYVQKVLVVSTNCGGVKEIIQDTRFIAENNNVNSLCESMKFAFYLNKEAKEDIKLENYIYYKKFFSSEVMLEKYETLYKEALGDV
ncbi:glycosyltransferase family 4 protein [Acinetobacter piscicola]|uniref:Glycosyltransferase family 4 protein n=1 Tax=Acinetobacter piscicola TaxID=2006115 RepID=A0A7S7AG43_9GAMM|nr:glycosyltransferase family 4 protein [Acinetobacter piscicola]QOW44511.1 glycosyltransferase family 4 protein [Acinetobacter piscicola]